MSCKRNPSSNVNDNNRLTIDGKNLGLVKMFARMCLFQFLLVIAVGFSWAVDYQTDEENPHNEARLDCVICTNTFDNNEFKRIGCEEHLYCNECLKAYFLMELRSNKYEFKCPDLECKNFLTPGNDLCNAHWVNGNKQNALNEIEQQSTKRRSYLCKEFLKGCCSYLCCAFNFFGCCSFTDIEVCPNCREIYQFAGGCNAIYHKECGRVFMKNGQCSIPLWDKICGCYFPVSLDACCSFGHAPGGGNIRCNTLPSCWCIDI